MADRPTPWLRLGLGALALALLSGTILVPPRPRLVWNVSRSAPTGLYLVRTGARIAQGDMVIARLPPPWRRLAAARHYVPANVPLVKRVAGVPGDQVCAGSGRLRINGRHQAERRPRDGAGRPIPAWRGCMTLPAGTWLLLMDAADSFDGRYFGPTEQRDIVGLAKPLWTG